MAQRQGELFFNVTSNVLDSEETSLEATSWTFEGTPVVEGQRLFVSARRSVPEDEIQVVCFDTVSLAAGAAERVRRNGRLHPRQSLP